jgi:hypothetical protein
MKLKAVGILFIIVLALIPVHSLYKYLQRVMRPKDSMRRFLFWMLTVLVLVFGYTFLVVFTIKMLFPGA